MISEIEIRLRADIARLQQDMNQARQAVSGGLDKINAAVGKTVGLLGGLAVGASAVSFAGFIKNSIDAADALNDLSSRTKVAIEDLSGLAYAAKLSDTSLEGAAQSINKLGMNIGKDAERFRALGISATDPLEAFKQLADIFKDIQDPQQRAAFGAETLGKSWAEAAPLLDNGAEGIAKLIERGKQLSGITQLSAEQAGALNDKLDELGFRAQGLGRKISADLVPGLNDAIGAITQAYEESGTLAALWATMGSLGAAVFTDQFSGAAKQLKNLETELDDLQTTLAQAKAAPAVGFIGRWLFGETEGELERRIAETQAKIKDLQSESRKAVEDSTDAFMKAVDTAVAAGQNALKVEEFMKAEEIAAAKKKAAEEAQRAAEKEREAYRSTVAAIEEKAAANKAEAASAVPLLESQRMRIKLDQDLRNGKLSLTKAHEAEVRAALDSLEAQERMQRAIKNTTDAQAELQDQREGAVRSATAEAEAQERLVAEFGKTKLAIEQAALARMEDRLAQRAALELDEQEVQQLEKLIAVKKRVVDASAQIEALETQKKATEEATKAQQAMWESIDKTAHDTFVSILDGNKNFAQRLKDTLKNTFFDWLYQMTVKKWLINVGIAGTGGGAAGLASAASGVAAGSGSMGGALGVLQTGKDIYSAITTGFTGVAASIGSSIAGLGGLLGSGSLGAFGTGMGLTSAQAAAAAQVYSAAGMEGIATSLTTGATAGAITTAAAGIAAGVLGGRLLSGGLSAFGGSGNSTVNAGTAIGAVVGSVVPVLGTAVGGLVGGLLGGAVNRLFGRGPKQIQSQGITGTFDASGFAGETFQNWRQKGGLFRSSKSGTDRQAVTGEMASALSESFGNVKAVTMAFATALGAPTDQITTYARKINVALTSDSAKNQEIFAQLLADIGNDLAYRIVPNLDKFQKENESASAALERVTGNYVALDAILGSVGTTFGAVGVGSLEARERLIELTGGIDKLATNTAAFAQNFLTEAERMAPVAASVTKALADMGLSWVDTREEFKQVVLATDKTTDAGARQFAALMNLQAAFAALYPPTEELTAALKAQQEAQKAAADQAAADAKALREKTISGLGNAVSDTLANLGMLVDKQKEQQKAAFDQVIDGINAGVDSTNKRLAKLHDLSNALAAFRPAAQTVAQQALSRQVGAAQLTSALAIAKASGILPTADSLQFALSAVSQDISGEFATSEDYQRAQLRAANDVAALNAMAGVQASIEEQTLKTLQDQKEAAQSNFDKQLGALDNLLAVSRQQADAANRTAENVAKATTVQDALAEFNRFAQLLVSARGADLPLSSLTQLSEGSTISQENVAALLFELQVLNEQMAGLKVEMAKTAANTGASASSGQQLAQQFDLVSAGGNALLTQAT